MDRGCGLFMPISALPNKYGYGCFSKEAYDFIDYLSNLKIKYWQIEPLNIFDKNSSSRVISSFAGNPLYLDIEKYLTVEEIDFFKLDNNLSYEDYIDKKNDVLRYIFDKMYYSTNIDKFIENNDSWVYDYAVFMALKDELNINYINFPNEYKNIDSAETISFIKTHSEEIIYYIFIQYLFFKQWKELKKYANLRGIKIITSTNLSVYEDSSDLYANEKLFKILNNESENKQVLFNFEIIKNEKFKYFINRYKFNSSIYDFNIISCENIESNIINELSNYLTSNNIKNIIFDNNYYCVSDNESNICNKNINSKYLIKNAIYGFINNDKDSLPNNYTKKIIGYLGLKNNKPLGYYLKNELFSEKICNYLNLIQNSDKSTIIKLAIENILASNADVCIINIQDIFCKNISVEDNINFNYRLKKNYQDENLFLYLKELIKNKNR